MTQRKRYNDLYAQICAYKNIYEAWKKARAGKRYRVTTANFEMNLDQELLSLYHDLLHETYTPGAYQHFIIHEPKRRLISAAPFRDRVAHHALCNILIPIYERKFIHDTYANRVGKGTHKALDRCTEYMRRFGYVLTCDVQQFFPSIDHQILKDILSHTIADARTMGLCAKIMDSGAGVLRDEYHMRYFAGDDLLAELRPRGLPIGNLTSQFWANVYLNEFDHFVKRKLKCRGYVRYVDDFLLFSDDKAQLSDWRDAIIDYMADLRLTLHENRLQPRPVSKGIPFLGFTVYPSHRRLRRTKGIAYRKRLKYLYGQYKAGTITREAGRSSVMAWIGHVQHGDTWRLQRKLFKEVVS